MEQERRRDDDQMNKQNQQPGQGRGWQSETERQGDAGREGTGSVGKEREQSEIGRKGEDVSKRGSNVGGGSPDRNRETHPDEDVRKREDRVDRIEE